MIMSEYWKIQEEEKEMLKEIVKWRYRSKHFPEWMRFYSDKELDKYIHGDNTASAEFTAKEVLKEYQQKLKALRTKDYKNTKRILNG